MLACQPLQIHPASSRHQNIIPETNELRRVSMLLKSELCDCGRHTAALAPLQWYFYGYKIQINCKPLRVRWLIQACPSVFVRGLARQNDSRVPMKYWVFTWLRFHLHMRVHDLSRNTPKKANQITAALATPPPRRHRPVSYTRLNYSAIKKPSLASIRPPRIQKLAIDLRDNYNIHVACIRSILSRSPSRRQSRDKR